MQAMATRTIKKLTETAQEVMRSIAPVSIKLTVARNSPNYCFFRASNTTHMTGLVRPAAEVASIESNQIYKQTALDRIDETVVFGDVAHLRARSSSLARAKEKRNVQ
jgi:hypothetical protein